MRTKLLWSLALLMLPIGLVGCDSGQNVVGTGTGKEPPPEVQERIKKEQESYQKMMQDQQNNPTPSQ